MPLVVKLKIRLPEMAASVITAKARTITPGGRSSAFFGRLAGGASSRGTRSAKSAEQVSAMSAGAAKAARQPKCFTRYPVRMAAMAMPRLPASPLTPMVKPGFFALCTIMGMPTG